MEDGRTVVAGAGSEQLPEARIACLEKTILNATRRSTVKGLAAGLTAFAFAGGEELLTPRQARAAGRPFQILAPDQAATLDALGDRLAFGAAENGLSHFVDLMVSVPFQNALLLVRYLGVQPPYAGFYTGGLAALEAFSQATYGAPFTQVSDAQRDGLITTISASQPDGWAGPPAPLFYFAVRSDAVDVVYGTVQGFANLGVPYMAHIEPPRIPA